jgi:hypothetical protein
MARDANRPGFSRRDFVVKGAVAGATLAAGSVAGTGSADAERGGPDGPADLVLVNGNILTLDAKNTVAGSIAITDGRITAVTRDSHGGQNANQVIDLRGRPSSRG